MGHRRLCNVANKVVDVVVNADAITDAIRGESIKVDIEKIGKGPKYGQKPVVSTIRLFTAVTA